MSALFSTVESVSLERNVELDNKVHKLSDIWDSENLNRCIKWTKENNFNKICLQFSDNLINHSIEIERQLKKHVESNVFILADTSYGSCCVDEVNFIKSIIVSNTFTFIISLDCCCSC